MKNLFYLVVSMLFTLNSFAQTAPAGENISLDQQLSSVNQSSVTSGIIYERTLQINFNSS